MSIGLGLFHRVQVLAQEVLDERDLEALDVGGVPHDRGDPVEAGLARRSPAPLAGDQLIAGRPTRRTTTGWITPEALIEAVSSSKASDSKIFLG